MYSMAGLRHEGLVIVAVFCSFFCMAYSDDVREIRLQGFLPMTGSGWPSGGASLPAILMAVRHVNERAGILDGYNLTFSWSDTQCGAGEATYQMFESLYEPPTKHMLIGAGCSVATMPTAEVSHLFNLTQISHASASPSLADRSRFPNLYMVNAPEHYTNPAKIALMREFNWTRVATINEAVEYHSMVIDDFVERVSEADDITIISQELFQDDPFRRVENLKKHDARIILVHVYESKARKVLCAAYRQGLYGRKYVWMYANWLSTGFWRPRGDVVCTEKEMAKAIEGVFLFGPYIRNSREEKGIAEITVSEFDALCRLEETYNAFHDSYFKWAAVSYDAVWISALALNCTETHLRSTGHPKYLDEFTYQDADINNVILSCMNNISFVGVSGHISYSSGTAPTRNVKIERIQDSKRILVGTYIRDIEPNKFEWLKDALKWEGNHIPRDALYTISEEISVPTWLYVCITFSAGLGLLAVVICLVFIIVYSQNSLMKLSSPIMNTIMLLGCAFIYSTVFFTTDIIGTSLLCKVRTYSFALGFTVIVGTYFFKTWRVYQTFISKKSISENNVIGITLVLIAGMAILLIIWEIVSPQILHQKELIKEVYVTDDDAEVRPFVRVCSSQYGVYFSWAVYIIEGAILALGAFLAFETRNVNIKSMNDSRQIGICLYNTMVLSAFGLTVSLLLEDNIVVVYGVTSGCIVIGTTVNVAVVFVPKTLQKILNIVLKHTNVRLLRNDQTSTQNMTETYNTDGLKAPSPGFTTATTDESKGEHHENTPI